MKKAWIIIFTLCCNLLSAQPFVNIPDPVFRQYISSILPGSITGTGLNTTFPGINSITTINVAGLNITDLTGVYYFPSVQTINCNNNLLTSVPALPNATKNFYCKNNNITTFAPLPASLRNLICDSNDIAVLGPLPNGVRTISCSHNLLTSITMLPSQLATLNCSYNSLTSLPALPANLTTLDCRHNSLASLPTLPNGLTTLTAVDNVNLYCMPNVPASPSFTSDIGTTVCVPRGTPDSWYKLPDAPAAIWTKAFAIDSLVYLMLTYASGGFWEYNPSTEIWTQKSSFSIFSDRTYTIAFSVGHKGYIGLGKNPTSPFYYNSFLEYDPQLNTWRSRAPYPYESGGNFCFTIGGRAYVGGGQNSSGYKTDMYEYDPLGNQWIPRAAFTGAGRINPGSFSIGDKGYVCGGRIESTYSASAYSYSQSTDTWSLIDSLPYAINSPCSFALNSRGYIVGGNPIGQTATDSVVEYNPVTNNWSYKASTPAFRLAEGASAGAAGKGFVGSGFNWNGTGYGNYRLWFEYSPPCYTPRTAIFHTGNLSFCSGDSIMLYADEGNKYQWKKNGVNIPGATSSSIYVKSSGNYTCRIVGSCAAVTSAVLNVTVNPKPSAAITVGGPTSFCTGDSVILTVPSGATLSYQWRQSGVVLPSAILNRYAAVQSGTYRVNVTDILTGCSQLTANAVSVTAKPRPQAVITPGGPTTFCAGSSVQLNANTGAGLTYQWKKNNVNIPAATASSYVASTAGAYKVAVSSTAGCSRNSAAVNVTVPCRVGETSDNNITVYPNPVSSQLKIETNDVTIISYELVSLTGQIIFRVSPDIANSTTTIDCSKMASGNYLLKIIKQDEVMTEKIVILHE